MKWLVVVPLTVVLAQAAPATPDLSPLAYWGVAGTLLSFILFFMWWMLNDERKSHKALQEKVVQDLLPAVASATEQLRASNDLLRQVASRPNVDPRDFEEWRRMVSLIKDRLESDSRRARDP